MGQCYSAINVDKKQKFGFDGGKLMEFSWKENSSVHRFMALMAGDWAGDRVFVVGDYADGERQDAADDVWVPVYKEVERELGIEGRIYTCSDGYSYPERLWDYAEHMFENVTAAADGLAASGARLRYIINGALGVFVDMEHCPADAFEPERDGSVSVWRVHPLPLLLAMGNGRGGGDYWGKFKEVLERVTPSVDARSLVGSWTATSASISFAKEGEEAKLRGLKEFCPDFSEVGEPVPWQEIGKRHAALEKDYRKSFKNLAAAFSRIRPDVVFGRTSSGQLMCCFG